MTDVSVVGCPPVVDCAAHRVHTAGVTTAGESVTGRRAMVAPRAWSHRG